MASSKPRFKLLESSDASLLVSPEYRDFIAALKSRVQAARISAARAVNSEIILLYWEIGQGIVERQQALGWGESVVELVAADLRREFPGATGFSARNVWDMRRLYLACTDAAVLAQAAREGPKLGARPILRQAVAELKEGEPAGADSKSKRPAALEFLRQLVAEVPWGQNLVILNKVTDPAARLWYLHSTARFGWSRNVLLNQIKAGAYERSVTDKKSHNFGLALPEHLAEQADEMLKSSYSLEFLGIRRAVRERELESRLISRLQAFLLELGYGFCFVGRQYRIAAGKKEYFIDLLFYHRFLKALVAFDLHPMRYESYQVPLRLRPSQRQRRSAIYGIHERPQAQVTRARARECPINRASLTSEACLLRSLPFSGRCHETGKVSQNRLGKAIHQRPNRHLSHGVKVGPFEPEFAGKMDFYLNVLNDKERGPNEQPSIGIVLCAEKDDIEVEYALRSKANPIGVATYQLQSKLPTDLKGKLPTQKQLADIVRAELEEGK